MARRRRPSDRSPKPSSPGRSPREAVGAPRAAGRGWRGWLVVGAAAAGLAAAALAWRFGLMPAVPEAPGSGPIVLISIDTLRADRLPIYGYDRVQTPAIDAFAREAVVFERAYAHAPQTLPAHVSLLTGLLPFEHGVRDNIGFAVKDGERMLQHLLAERGYTTAGLVSSYVLRKETGISQGFDFYDSELPPTSPDTPISYITRDGSETLAATERWLEEQDSSTFFLFFHIYEPHTPYEPPDRFGQYEPYDGEVAYSDEIVGRLLDVLRARGVYDEATIILLSDHGEGLGDHGELEHGVFLYDQTIRIPFLVKLPGGAHGGRRVEAPVQQIDLAPTLLDLAGGADTSAFRGRSLQPLLEESGTVAEQGIFSESLYARYHFGWSELYALTDARFRLIRAPRDELYDLQTDPGETTNLAEERPQARQAMRAAIDRLLAGATIDTPEAVTAEQREQFQALGYVGMQADVDPSVSGDTLPDPKDKIDVLRRYREALDLASKRRFADAVPLLQEILAGNPSMADVWQQLGMLLTRLGRMDEAIEAYRTFVELKPSEPGGLVIMGSVLLKQGQLDEAERHAALAAEIAREHDRRSRSGAYELLGRIALKKKDREAAMRYAKLAEQADPTLPMPAYMQGLIAHAEGRYADAWPYLEEALAQAEARGITMTELHFHAGDTLARLGRNDEAEEQFRTEIRIFPDNLRARASLAMLLRSVGRDAEADRTIVEMMRWSPTPEAFDLAARLWRMFGEPERADAVRRAIEREFQAGPAGAGTREPR